MIVELEIRAEHIEDGRRHDKYACALALALRDAFPGLRPLVGRGSVSYSPDGGGVGTNYESCLRSLPEATERFRAAYDAGEAVSAGRYPVDVPLGTAARLGLPHKTMRAFLAEHRDEIDATVAKRLRVDRVELSDSKRRHWISIDFELRRMAVREHVPVQLN